MFLGLSTRITRPGGSDAPTLTLELLKNSLDSRLTFSRASSATDIVSGVLTTYAADVPRITLAEGLLLEESRTNLLYPSEALASPWATAGASLVLDNAVLNPTGTSGAYKLTEGTSTGAHEASRQVSSLTASSKYAQSVFLKAAGRSYAQVTSWDGNAATLGTAVVNLTDGTVLSGSANVQACANGWYRVMMAGTLGASATSNFLIVRPHNGTSTNYTGDGSSGVYVWGAQMEAGAFCSSYIPASASAATRAADSCSMNVAALLNLSEGTVWVEAKSGSGADAAAATSPRLLRLDDGSSTNLHEIRRNAADNVLRGVTTTGGADQAVIVGAAFAVSTQLRAAYAYRANDMAFCQAAASVGADVTGTMPSGITTLRLGAAAAGSGLFNGYIRGVKYWNKRLTNTQLQGVTA